MEINCLLYGQFTLTTLTRHSSTVGDSQRPSTF